jgi:bacterioferritin-associated ferredoxin
MTDEDVAKAIAELGNLPEFKRVVACGCGECQYAAQTLTRTRLDKLWVNDITDDQLYRHFYRLAGGHGNGDYRNSEDYGNSEY